MKAGVMPDLTRELQYGGRVAGVDEVGRGPLAGPVVAAAVVFGAGVPDDLAAIIDDSKKLKPQLRAFIAARLPEVPGVEIGLGAVSAPAIDRLNIHNAAHLAMQRAVARLPRLPDHVLVDGNKKPDFGCSAECLVGGDSLSLSIAAASVIAKVTRDRIMNSLDQRWPAYGWAKNSGYGTAVHRQALIASGITPHHRKTFGTVRKQFELYYAGEQV
ncbi:MULTISPECIES: ribonuclease HII [Acetobacter]|uniref:Ribonuclease HII n=1 Tax=Acetobacter thailandicus TaxID=1502842 RepID=A0ABT3QF91_9PROT|nr:MULTISPECIES: ribonuclease HII [Acetobacter]MBS0960094.1 ribonuclease HII [Acetobacter thailandicus]MBS0979423.1 ribonuclease HII [Acetobacter thailandicus]MBS0985627.1 ribonuclease HII [Acetobacter thailandicus]MBS1002542.1 ribonuclease HII [Acetobacter thailandicus]MCX2563958.1 ribonuclease HII [Acetobacter thailandicus]